MKITNQSYEIIDELDGFAVLKKLERVGRICYKSEHKIGMVPCPKCKTEEKCPFEKYHDNEGNVHSSIPFMNMILHEKNHASILEHHFFTAKLTCNRAIQNEIVRHRLASFAVESSRYNSYNKDKFDNQITIVKPIWINEKILDEVIKLMVNSHDPMGLIDQSMHENLILEDGRSIYDTPEYVFLTVNSGIEKAYMELTEMGIKAEYARDVLPLCLKTEMFITANLREWRHIFLLRTSKAAHKELVQLMYNLLLEVNSKIPLLFEDLLKV